MYGVEWLIGLVLLGGLVGLGGGYLLAGRNSGSRHRELEAELAGARRELADYRQEVVKQFSETARKFQTLNDSYTDLHEQLARSSSVLCGDITGPLLAAPAGHQDLIPAQARERVLPKNDDAAPDEPDVDESVDATVGEAPTPGVTDPYDDAAEIRVPEPGSATAPEAEGEQARDTDATPRSATAG